MCETLIMDSGKKYWVSLYYSQQTSQPQTQPKEQIKIVSEELNFIIVLKWKCLLFITFFFIDEPN